MRPTGAVAAYLVAPEAPARRREGAGGRRRGDRHRRSVTPAASECPCSSCPCPRRFDPGPIPSTRTGPISSPSRTRWPSGSPRRSPSALTGRTLLGRSAQARPRGLRGVSARTLLVVAVRSGQPGQGLRVLRRGGPARSPYAPPHAGLADCPPLLGLGGLCPLATPGTSRRSAPSARSPSIPSAPRPSCRAPTPACSATGTGRGARLALEPRPRPRPAAGLRAPLAGASSWPSSATSSGARLAIHRGREIDPLSGLGSALRCLFHEIAGGLRGRAGPGAPGHRAAARHFLGYWSLGLANVQLGQHEAGQAALQRALELTEQGPVDAGPVRLGLARAGERGRGTSKASKSRRPAAATFVSPCQRAVVLAALGDLEGGLSRVSRKGSSARPLGRVRGRGPVARALSQRAALPGVAPPAGPAVLRRLTRRIESADPPAGIRRPEGLPSLPRA